MTSYFVCSFVDELLTVSEAQKMQQNHRHFRCYQSPLLAQIATTILVRTDSVIYFQFEFPLLVCFYTMVEVK